MLPMICYIITKSEIEETVTDKYPTGRSRKLINREGQIIII